MNKFGTAKGEHRDEPPGCAPANCSCVEICSHTRYTDAAGDSSGSRVCGCVWLPTYRIVFHSDHISTVSSCNERSTCDCSAPCYNYNFVRISCTSHAYARVSLQRTVTTTTLYVRINSFMHTLDMLFQTAASTELLVALGARKWFLFVVHRTYVHSYILGACKKLTTLWTRNPFIIVKHKA